MSHRFVLADSEEEKRAVRRLRYGVMVDELHYRVPGASAEEGLASADDAHSLLVLGYDDEVAVGTITYTPLAAGPPSEQLLTRFQLQPFLHSFPTAAIAILHKAAIQPAYRGSGLLMEMIAWLFPIGNTPELRFLFLDCSPYLVAYYERLGFRRYAPHFYYDDSGILSVPLCLVLRDQLHLERVGSFLAALQRHAGMPDDPDARRFFEERWTYRPERPASLLPIPEPPPSHPESTTPAPSPLIQGLSLEDLELFFTRFVPIAFERKQILMEAGEPAREIFLIHEGFVEVLVQQQDQALPIATIGPGEIVGEIGALLERPRSATVRCLTRGICIKMGTAELQALLAERPSLGAQLYRNVARLLAERLRSTSLRITAMPSL